MVGVFCFCWTPYATISMAAILGYAKVTSFNDNIIDINMSQTEKLKEKKLGLCPKQWVGGG